MVTATFPPYWAGTGNVVFHQARCLAARGHDVEVFTATYPGPPADPPGVRVHRSRPVLRLGNAPLLPGLLRLPETDVIHLHQPFIFGAELTALRPRARVVSTFHNELLGDGVKGALFRGYSRTALRFALARSDRLVVVAKDHAASVAPLARELALRPEAFAEVPNGVDVDEFSPDGGEPGDAAIFVAALDGAHRFKRLDLLLDALEDVPGLRLRVVGGGPDLPRHQERARGLGGRVEFLGARPHSQLPALLRESGFLVLCSDAVESFGLVQVEALSCGIPVIASALPGVRTVVEPGVDGLHVTPGSRDSLVEALRRMAAMPAFERAAMGARGREKVLERYTWERSAERLEAVYAR